MLKLTKKIQGHLLWFSRQHKMCFTKPDWEFLYENHNIVSDFYSLHKIHKYISTESTINTENTEIFEITESNDLEQWPIVSGPTCKTRKLDQVTGIPL